MPWKYRQPRPPNGPVHKVHVDRSGTEFPHERCNLDDAAAGPLLDRRPPGPGCKHCKPDELDAPEEEDEDDPAEPPGPRRRGLSSDLPLRSRAGVAALALLAGLGLATGVVASPDQATVAVTPSPGPSVDMVAIEQLIEDKLLIYHRHDHGDEFGSPSPWPSPTSTPGVSPSPSPRAEPTRGPSPAPTSSPRSAPTSKPRSTPRPTPVPTAAPTAAPSPCFRPGDPKSGKDPCRWPPDD